MESDAANGLYWTVHLAKREPRKALVVVLLAVFAGLLGVLLVGSIWMFPVGALVILVGIADFLLPVRFEVSERGARSRCGLSASSIRWENVKRVLTGEDGVKLSPLEKRSRLSAFRGVFLRADGNLQEIVGAVEYWRNQHAADVGRSANGRGKEPAH